MDLYPAIDLRGGRCVRLYQGDYDRETVYGDDPLAQARLFGAAGAEWVHMVDLDAARTGDPTNRAVITTVAAAVTTGIQAGGGVRDDASARALLDAGVARVVIGTAAVEQPAWACDLAGRYPGRVVLGLDVRGRAVAVRGWLEDSQRGIHEVTADFASAPFAAMVVTQIDVDGVGSGPDLELYRELLASSPLELVASGGVGSAEHLRALASLQVGGRSVDGVIVGRALYDGSLTIEQALDACRS